MADVEKILGTDTLRQAYPKLNQAIDNSNEALNTANTAIQTAVDAKNMADIVQEQFNQVVIQGDSSVEAAQARVDENGTTYTTLKERLDTEHSSVTSQLAEKANQTDVNNSLSLKANKDYVDTAVNPKADKDYVDSEIAKKANGAPKGVYATLIDLQTALPTGSADNQLVTSDGNWYFWSGSAWTAGGIYQSTGIGDGTVTRNTVSKSAKRTMDLLNSRNIFKNPNFNDHSSWGFIVTDFTIDEINATILSNSAKVPVDATNLPYLYQDIPLSEFIDGNYTLSFLLKTDSDTNSNVSIGVTGYPTTANSGGTSLFSLADQRAWVINGGEWQRNTFTFDLAGVSAYDHIRVFIQMRNASRNYYFAEMYLGLSNQIDNSFSYIFNRINGNKLLGKSLYIDGNSISYGAGYVGGYGKILSDDYGAIVTNKAVSGGTLASGTTYGDGSPRHYICDSVASNLATNYDFAIISGGYNDYGNNVPLGALDNGDYSFESALDKTTVIGALESIFRYIMQNYPETKLFFLMAHKVNRTTTVKNGLGLSMQDYYEAIKSVCGRYAVPMIDIFNKSRFITYFTSMKTYTIDDDGDGQPDGTHPTEDGYRKFYLPVIEKVIGL